MPESLLPAAVVLLRVILRVLGTTYRDQPPLGNENLGALLDHSQPVIVSFWHNRIFQATHFLLDQSLHRQGLDLTVLVSRSRDGELATRMARGCGLRVVRGSTSRGGQGSLIGLYRSIVKDRSSALVVPDGPRGPRYTCKLGAISLAQLSRAPILPLSFAAEGFWSLPSWDRLRIPRPFTRVVAAIGEPLTVPRHLSDDEREKARERLKRILDQLGRDAERSLQASSSSGLREDGRHGLD